MLLRKVRPLGRIYWQWEACNSNWQGLCSQTITELRTVNGVPQAITKDSGGGRTCWKEICFCLPQCQLALEFQPEIDSWHSRLTETLWFIECMHSCNHNATDFQETFRRDYDSSKLSHHGYFILRWLEHLTWCCTAYAILIHINIIQENSWSIGFLTAPCWPINLDFWHLFNATTEYQLQSTRKAAKWDTEISSQRLTALMIHRTEKPS